MSQLGAVVQPFELQGPAALSHAGQDQPVSLQVNLGLRRLHLKVRRDVIYWREERTGRGRDTRVEAESRGDARTKASRHATT